MADEDLSRRKLLELTATAGVTTTIGFSGPALAEEDEPSDDEDKPPKYFQAIKAQNGRERPVTVILRIYKLGKGLERTSDEPIQTFVFRLNERGEEGAKVLSSLYLWFGPYDVVAEITQTGETSNCMWGVPTGGVPESSALTVQTRSSSDGMTVGETEF